MSVLAWRLLATACLLLFFICIIIQKVCGFNANTLYKNFASDELIKKSKGINSTNYLYLTNRETSQFIDKYVVMHTFADKLLVCHYTKPYKKIIYTIIQLSKNQKVINVSKCVELMTCDSSKIITLKKRCKFVQVVVNKVDTILVNKSAIKPLSKSYINKYCFFKYFSLVGIFMAIRHTLFEIFFGFYFMRAMLNSLLNYGLIALCLLVPAIIVIFYKIGYNSKSIKARNGRALTYEFV